MPKVKMNCERAMCLPGDFLERRHIQPEREYWLDARNRELILYPCLPDVHKLYLEPTTACNLECRTCIRHAWVSWATQELPRMHWGAERRCKFVQDHAMVVGWDGGVSPCYALSHNYSYFTIDGIQKLSSAICLEV